MDISKLEDGNSSGKRSLTSRYKGQKPGTIDAIAEGVDRDLQAMRVAEATEAAHRSILDKAIGIESVSRSPVGKTIAEAAEAAHRSMLDKVIGIESVSRLSVGKTVADLAEAQYAFGEKLACLDGGLVSGLSKRSLSGYEDLDTFPKLPPIPKNPILETNDLLKAVSKDMASLKSITLATAEVHQKQMESISNLANTIDAVVASQEKSGKILFKITIASLLVAIVSAIAAIIPLKPILFD